MGPTSSQWSLILLRFNQKPSDERAAKLTSVASNCLLEQNRSQHVNLHHAGARGRTLRELARRGRLVCVLGTDEFDAW